jgi:hypothetical protein
MKPLKAVYNFIVGDMIILIGILIAVVLLIIINKVPALSALQNLSGGIFIVLTLLTLMITLAREAYSSKR